jgi:hypothetical protein
MNLATLPNLQAQMLLAIKNLARHDSLGAEVIRHSSPSREEVEHADAIHDNMDRQQLWCLLEREVVSTGSAPFLYNPNSSLDLGHMLIGASQINDRSIWNRLDQWLQGRKLSIGMNHSDEKTAMKTTLVNFLESLEHVWNRAVRKMINSCETDFTAK